jgi:hypothetical protein
MSAWMEGLFRWPRLEVVWRGSCPSMMAWGLIKRKASMTTCEMQGVRKACHCISSRAHIQ